MFALYAVTLPEMDPMKALRSARHLVFSRRLVITSRLLVLPLLAIAVLILLLVPAIYFAPAIAPWFYFVMLGGAIVFTHAYLFVLYKELL